MRTKEIQLIEATLGFKKLFGEVLPIKVSMKLSSHGIRGNSLPCGQAIGMKNRNKWLAFSVKRDD